MSTHRQKALSVFLVFFITGIAVAETAEETPFFVRVHHHQDFLDLKYNIPGVSVSMTTNGCANIIFSYTGGDKEGLYFRSEAINHKAVIHSGGVVQLTPHSLFRIEVPNTGSPPHGGEFLVNTYFGYSHTPSTITNNAFQVFVQMGPQEQRRAVWHDGYAVFESKPQGLANQKQENVSSGEALGEKRGREENRGQPDGLGTGQK